MRQIDDQRGCRICSRMKQLKLTVRETAKATKVSPSSISAWREGRAIATNRISLLCDVLHVSETWLLRGSEKALTSEEITLITKYRALPKCIQNAITTVADSLFTYHTETQRKDDPA